MDRMTSETCSITCTACSPSKLESRNGYGKRSRSHSTSARLAGWRSIPIAPAFLLIPHPTSRIRMDSRLYLFRRKTPTRVKLVVGRSSIHVVDHDHVQRLFLLREHQPELLT